MPHSGAVLFPDMPAWGGPGLLMAATAFDAGARFSARVRNKSAKAAGLIQFMPKIAARRQG
jgi:hypothetical protein